MPAKGLLAKNHTEPEAMIPKRPHSPFALGSTPSSRNTHSSEEAEHEAMWPIVKFRVSGPGLRSASEQLCNHLLKLLHPHLKTKPDIHPCRAATGTAWDKQQSPGGVAGVPLPLLSVGMSTAFHFLTGQDGERVEGKKAKDEQTQTFQCEHKLEPKSRRARLGQRAALRSPGSEAWLGRTLAKGYRLASHDSLGLHPCKYTAEAVTIMRTRKTPIYRHGTWLAPRGMRWMDGTEGQGQ